MNIVVIGAGYVGLPLIESSAISQKVGSQNPLTPESGPTTID